LFNFSLTFRSFVLLSSPQQINPTKTMSYKAGIVKAISELKDRTGSSSIAIKKHMQANMPADKKWMNATFLKALRDGVAAGDLIQVKGSYKLSAKAKTAGKPKKAPKKKAAPKKTAPKKKSAPKKKTVRI
jgi:histone H1/5